MMRGLVKLVLRCAQVAAALGGLWICWRMVRILLGVT